VADTLSAHILTFVAAHPGRTAWGITKELCLQETPSGDPRFLTGSVSALLCRMAKDGRLGRRRGARGSWTYYARKRLARLL
jgi:hypothetical protein